jgi:hypothetical protein
MTAFDADSGLVLYAVPPAEGVAEEYFIRNTDGTLAQVGRLQEDPGRSGALASTLVSTPDMSRFAYDGQKLWAFDASEHALQPYEYPGESGHPFLVAVTGSRGSNSLIGVCGAVLGGRATPSSFLGTMAENGRAAVFTVQPCKEGSGENAGKAVPAATIYERVESASTGAMSTVLVSGSGSPCDEACENAPAGDASYEGAAADGARVFFLSTRRLDDEASEDPRRTDSAFSSSCAEASSSGCNLYMFECGSGCEHPETDKRLVDVSAGDTSGLGPRVQGVMAIAESGSTVYFVARGVLAGPNHEGAVPAPGGENLYVYGPDKLGHERTAFVASLSPDDANTWRDGVASANVTPDGRFLVFTSHGALTPDVTRVEGPSQVYRYDAESEELQRISIGEEGFNDNGNNGLGNARVAEAYRSFESNGRFDPTMSDDGRFVFFESPIGLTPKALNDEAVIGNQNVLAENIYEWEASGTKGSESSGECEQPGGCVWLITDGRDRTEGSDIRHNESAVELLGSDATGENVFFTTAEPLVSGDTDTQVDIYDARVDGGFAASVEKEPCTSLKECHGAPPEEEVAFEVLSSVIAPVIGNFTEGSGNGGGSGENGGGSVEGKRHTTSAQQLSRALAKCRKAREKNKRVACEHAARRTYRAQLLSKAISSCRHDPAGSRRKACERLARRKYQTTKSAKRTRT